MFAHRYSSVTGRTLIMCRFARLNAAISVNLKPNEDGEYAEVQKHICHFVSIFYLYVRMSVSNRANLGNVFNSWGSHASNANDVT